jgi:tRNA(Ile)-lysidine synthase
LQEDTEVLDQLASELARSALDGAALQLAVIRGRPAALRRRALRWWLLGAGVTGLTSDHLSRVDRLALNPTGNGAVRLPGNLDVVTDAGMMRLRPGG